MLSAERERWRRYVSDRPVRTFCDVACSLLSDMRSEAPGSWAEHTYRLMYRHLFDVDVARFLSELLVEKG